MFQIIVTIIGGRQQSNHEWNVVEDLSRFCAALLASGVGHLVKFDGIMKTEKCIFMQHEEPSEKNLMGSSFNFQHDNDPNHTDNAVKSFGGKKQKNTRNEILSVMD